MFNPSLHWLCTVAASWRGISDLPQEVQNIIIDYLEDNKASLKSCALSMRCWLNQCCQHLHRVAYVTGISQDDTDRYTGTTSEVAQYVQEVRYASHMYTVANSILFFHNLFAVPLSMLLRFPSAKGLRMSMLSFSRCSLDDTDALAGAFPHLTKLSLQACTFESFEDFMVILSAFPHVQTLVLSDVFFCTPTEPQTAHGIACPRLSFLALWHCTIRDGEVSTWLSHPARYFMADFHLDWSCGEPLEGVILTLGSYIAHLTICFVAPGDEACEWRDFQTRVVC